jgi:hypothetical protein
LRRFSERGLNKPFCADTYLKNVKEKKTIELLLGSESAKKPMFSNLWKYF